MLNAHRSSSAARQRSLRQVRRDEGYVLAMTALLILPLMAFCGLAVDLGAWYTRAAQLQRVADAAALAGVTSLPKGSAEASIAARAVARQNGFPDTATDSITITAAPDGPDRYKVEITDADVPQYFTTLFRSSVSITRASVAEYAPPVRMGSPRNFLGTEYLGPSGAGVPSGAIEGFWLSASSPCSPAEDGDKLLPRRAATASGWNCNGGIDNPTRDDNGYIYGVRVEPGYSRGSITLEIYDAPMCASSSSASSDLYTGGQTFDTTYTVRQPSLNPLDGAVITQFTAVGQNNTSSGHCSNSGTNGYRGRWRTLATINSPQAGRTYTVQVTTSNPGSGRGPSNNFSLRARTGPTFQACSADPAELPTSPLRQAATGIAPVQCPNLFAMQDLSIYARSSGTASFFLASIGPEHGGKTLVVDLFDPGEEAEWMEVLDPNGNRVSFDWRVVPRYPSEATPTGGWSGTTNRISVAGSGTQPGPNRANPYRYNDRQLQLEIELPDDYSDAYGSRTWWRIQYRFGSNPTDRTTWSVSVIGDPVRIVE